MFPRRRKPFPRSRLTPPSASDALLRGVHQVHAKPNSWLSYWHFLDEKCRGGSGDDAKTWQACDKRSAIDKILVNHGCSFRYPSGWPELRGEYTCVDWPQLQYYFTCRRVGGGPVVRLGGGSAVRPKSRDPTSSEGNFNSRPIASIVLPSLQSS